MRKYGMRCILMTLLACILAGCSHHPTYGTPPPINKLKWGMNVKETFHVLGIADKDVTQITLGTTITYLAKEKMKINDRFADVSFTFDTYFPEPVLIGITAKFQPEDVEHAEKELNKQRGNGDYQYTAASEPSNVSWKDDTLDTNKAWKTKVEAIYRNNGIAVTDNLLENGAGVGGKPVTSCILTLDRQSSLYGTVHYNGQVAAMLNYPERFASISKTGH